MRSKYKVTSEDVRKVMVANAEYLGAKVVVVDGGIEVESPEWWCPRDVQALAHEMEELMEWEKQGGAVEERAMEDILRAAEVLGLTTIAVYAPGGEDAPLRALTLAVSEEALEASRKDEEGE